MVIKDKHDQAVTKDERVDDVMHHAALCAHVNFNEHIACNDLVPAGKLKPPEGSRSL